MIKYDLFLSKKKTTCPTEHDAEHVLMTLLVPEVV